MSNPLPSGSRPITLCVNGQNLTAHAEPRVNLADFLRHDLDNIKLCKFPEVTNMLA